MTGFWQGVVEPGFFSSAPVHSAVAVGAIVAVVSGMTGVFTVIRGHSFAGEALGDIGSTGGSASYLLGINPLIGFLGLSVLGAGLMSATGARTRKARDVETGIVVGGALGLAALFLYLDTTRTSTTGAPVTILFGSIFTVPSSTLPIVAVLGGVTLTILLALYRMLLLTSLNPGLAAARGTSVRLVAVAYLALLAVAVSLSAITIGTILSTALLIGPPATALRLTDSPGRATVLAAVIGVASTWLGILLAYDSDYWPRQHGWPASFLIVTIIVAGYLLARVFGRDIRQPAFG
ncbi:MAG TPA: metal ABC transporter permease [Mycobacteriales bacterium]|nr:metal ABC transporter permease [Mycobacteriales bacterium]